MPAAEMMRSTVMVCVAPPDSTVAVMLSPPLRAAVTLAPVMILMPCFSNALRAKALISLSSTGSTRSSTSTTVTSAPMLR